MRLNYFQSFGLRNDLSRSFFVFNGEIRLGAWYVFLFNFISIFKYVLVIYSLFVVTHYATFQFLCIEGTFCQSARPGHIAWRPLSPTRSAHVCSMRRCLSRTRLQSCSIYTATWAPGMQLCD